MRTEAKHLIPHTKSGTIKTRVLAFFCFTRDTWRRKKPAPELGEARRAQRRSLATLFTFSVVLSSYRCLEETILECILTRGCCCCCLLLLPSPPCPSSSFFFLLFLPTFLLSHLLFFPSHVLSHSFSFSSSLLFPCSTVLLLPFHLLISSTPLLLVLILPQLLILLLLLLSLLLIILLLPLSPILFLFLLLIYLFLLLIFIFLLVVQPPRFSSPFYLTRGH